MLVLETLLTALTMPLGVSLFAVLLGLAALALCRRRTAGGLLTFGLLWLWGWSTPLGSGLVRSTLEAPFPPPSIKALPAADAIVLLGGGLNLLSADRSHPDLKDSADRIWLAARLYQAGKAPLIIATGGYRWPRHLQGKSNFRSEAEAMGVLLTAFGVPQAAILEERRSRTTRENAVLTTELAAARDIRQVLLVTSAWHMPRALAAFRRAGLAVIPAGTDYGRPDSTPPVFLLLPSANHLAQSSQMLREHLGLLMYQLRGWA